MTTSHYSGATNALFRVAGVALILLDGIARAAAPAPHQVPAYYALQLGSVRVVALLDGIHPLPPGYLTGVNPKIADTLNRANFVPQTAEGVTTAFNAYLVDTGSKRVLIDAGLHSVSARCWERYPSNFEQPVTTLPTLMTF